MAKLSSYPTVASVTVGFSITITNPCLTTYLYGGSVLDDMVVTLQSGLEGMQSQYLSPVYDSAGTTANKPSLCGNKVYTIVEPEVQTLFTINPPGIYSGSLKVVSNNFADYGIYTVTLKVSLESYPNVAPVTRTFTLQVSKIVVQEMIPTEYQIKFGGSSGVVMTFPMHGDLYGLPPEDSLKTYSITYYPWLSMTTPATSTGYYQLVVSSQDYLDAGYFDVDLVVGFVNSSITETITHKFELHLHHPCKETLITTS